MNANNITRRIVIHRELVPEHYGCILPFTVTIHFKESQMSESDLALVEDAIINAAHELRRRYRPDETEPFYDSEQLSV